MRIYIIGNDGITLCRNAPATVNDGEIVIASNAELHAAAVSGKRLVALWNALPGVEKRKKVGDRDALIDQLWSAIEMLPDPEPQPDPKRPSKQDVVIAMLRQPEGATVDEVASVIGWQRHTVRGVFSASSSGSPKPMTSGERSQSPSMTASTTSSPPAQPLSSSLFATRFTRAPNLAPERRDMRRETVLGTPSRAGAPGRARPPHN
jgi:Protein of unknown function (DUF3489)